METLPDLVVPFKRKTYERVVREFTSLASNHCLSREFMRCHARESGHPVNSIVSFYHCG